MKTATLISAILLIFCLQAGYPDDPGKAPGGRESGAARERQRGITTEPHAVAVNLTARERAWLKAHPRITVVSDSAWPPIEFVDRRGNLLGLSHDYLQLIEQRLGVRFVRLRARNWKEAYERLKRHEIDMTTSVSATPERRKFWLFTRPYIEIPIVIFARTEVTYIHSMAELNGKQVAVVDGYALNDWIPRGYPAIRLVRVADASEGLGLLRQGRVFAYIDNMMVGGYFIARMKSADIKIAGETPYENAQSMAVRNDWPELASILQKALDSISPAERAYIYQKWVPARYERGFNYGYLWRILAACALIIAGLVFWNRRMSREIKTRKKAEEALRLANARFHRIVDANIIGIIIATAGGKILEANDYYLGLIGYTREDLERGAVDWRSVTPPEWLPADEKALAELRERGSCTPYEKEYVCSDGSRVPVLIVDTLLPGPEEEIAGFVFDMTRIKQAEEKFRRLNEELEARVQSRTAQLEAVNGELEAFTYSVSHDLRAPLRAVDGFVHILEEDFGPRLGDEGMKLCSRISANAKSMGQLIDDLLAFSRIGRAGMTLSDVDMAGLARGAFDELTTPESRRKIDFQTGPLPVAVGDRALLRQVWLNLIGNAVKFSSKRERPSIEVRGEEKGGEIVYSVRDNGAGFDMRYASKLFGVFQRLHSASEFEGTGVGLAIVQRIILRHGGRLWAESEPDKGAIFHFSLPLAR